MAKPSSLAMAALKPLGRYRRSHPRMVFSLPFQEAEGIEVYPDTGLGRLHPHPEVDLRWVHDGGSHVTKCWSSTRANLALSNGEAEYYGVVRVAGIGLG